MTNISSEETTPLSPPLNPELGSFPQKSIFFIEIAPSCVNEWKFGCDVFRKNIPRKKILGVPEQHNAKKLTISDILTHIQ